MSRTDPGGGLPAGTTSKGWVRSDEQGDYVPCGCGQGVQRPDDDVQAQVAGEYGAAGVEIDRVFVCERDVCDRRTGERAADTDMEDTR